MFSGLAGCWASRVFGSTPHMPKSEVTKLAHYCEVWELRSIACNMAAPSGKRPVVGLMNSHCLACEFNR